MTRDMKKVAAALNNPQPALGGPAYGISNDGKKIVIANETKSGDFVSFEYSALQLRMTLMELRVASARAAEIEAGRDPNNKGSEVIEAKRGAVVAGEDGRSLLLLFEDDRLKYLVPLQIDFANLLRDHLDKALRALHSETSGTKGSA
jgi:hypothetical protein